VKHAAFIVAMVVLNYPAQSWCQQVAEPEQNAAEPLIQIPSQADVEKWIKQLDETADLDESVKTKARELLDNAKKERPRLSSFPEVDSDRCWATFASF